MSFLGGFGEEIGLISPDLLSRLIKEQAPPSVAIYGDNSGADDADVQSLRIDFQRILRIDYLWPFKNLKKLQLDNNLIEKIENLDSLVHLEWLDLSFNNITKIEGLNALVALRDLSLHNNHISKLEGLDSVVALETLSIGNNDLASMESAPVLYLRQFKGLRCVNFGGNALADEEKYDSFVIAYLPQLKFLDYKRITDSNRSAARAMYADKLDILEAREEELLQIQQAEEEKKKKAQQYVDACVPGLHDETFFNASMDAEYCKLKIVPSVNDQFTSFLLLISLRFKKIAAAALSQRTIRLEEQQQFFEAVNQGKADSRAACSDLITEYMKFREKVYLDVNVMTEAQSIVRLTRLGKDLVELKRSLMALEVDIVAQLEETFKKFERNYSDLITSFIESVQAVVTEIRESEELFHKEVTELSNAFSDRFSKGEIENALEYPDDIHTLLRDKAVLTNVLNAGHDATLLALDAKEDEILAAAKTELEHLIQTIHKEEVTRNRTRVAEICRFIEYEQQTIEQTIEDLSESA